MLDLAAHAERLGIPRRTKDQVIAALARAAKNRADKSMATMMLNHGRLEDDAREFVIAYLK